MKLIASSLVLLFGISSVLGQVGPSAGASGNPQQGAGAPGMPPALSGPLAEIFADHESYSAELMVEIEPEPLADPMRLPGKVFFLEGKTRFEQDLTRATGLPLPEEAKAQLKKMGMAEMAVISDTETETSYLIYPQLKSYVEMPVPDEAIGEPEREFKVEKTEIGKETVNGHATMKTEVSITPEGQEPLEATVWYATDLKNFPVQIQTVQKGHRLTMQFREVDLGKPDADLFEPPSDFKRYENVMELMQETMMKQFDQ